MADEEKKKSATPALQGKNTTPVVEKAPEEVKEEAVTEMSVTTEESNEQANLLVYRHKTVSRFSCAGFEFVDHLCYVKEIDEARFLKVYESLNRKDRINIVRLPAVPVELSVYRENKGSVVRGPTTAPTKKH